MFCNRNFCFTHNLSKFHLCTMYVHAPRVPVLLCRLVYSLCDLISWNQSRRFMKNLILGLCTYDTKRPRGNLFLRPHYKRCRMNKMTMVLESLVDVRFSLLNIQRIPTSTCVLHALFSAKLCCQNQHIYEIICFTISTNKNALEVLRQLCFVALGRYMLYLALIIRLWFLLYLFT